MHVSYNECTLMKGCEGKDLRVFQNDRSELETSRKILNLLLKCISL